MEIGDVDISKRSFHVQTRHYSLARTIHQESRVLPIQSKPLKHYEGHLYLQKNLDTSSSADSDMPCRVSGARLPLGVHVVRIRAPDCVAAEGSTQELYASIKVTASIQHSLGSETELRPSTSSVTLEVPVLACTICEEVSGCQPRLTTDDITSTMLSSILQGSGIPKGLTASVASCESLSPPCVVVSGKGVDCTRMHGGARSRGVATTRFRQRWVWFIDLTQLSPQDSTVLIDQTTGWILVPTALKCQYDTFPLHSSVPSISQRTTCEALTKRRGLFHSGEKGSPIVKQRRVVLLNDVLALNHLIQKTDAEGGGCISAEIPVLSFKLVSINLRKRSHRG
ncbi:unnamed protein product [Phytomonas sp. EM1]|nr:unnamed protein product [Phytomonas sp. EM1]|eukprot:CCW59695.1 unnamed protein product [Phytomonas sp. isolate EM1]